jgi:hypothetical protein
MVIALMEGEEADAAQAISERGERVYVSFWRAQNIFKSAFNTLASTLTACEGVSEFCHCDLVLRAPVEMVQCEISKALQSTDDNLRHHVEQCFIEDPYARKAISKQTGHVCIAFSALWGMTLQARVLRRQASSAWYNEPMESDAVEWVEVEGLQHEKQFEHMLSYSIQQVGKKYASINAVLSCAGKCNIFPNQDENEAHFCSELCANTLLRAGIIQNVIPVQQTPNSFYVELQRHNLNIKSQ